MADEDAARLLRRVLVVEDEAIVGMGLVAYLEELGLNVTWTGSVEESLAAIRQNQSFDVAIVDLNLNGTISTPVIDELIGKQVHTVICSGYDTDILEERFRSLPRTGKPFTRASLRGHLADHIA